MRRLGKFIGLTVAAAALAGIFALYGRSDFLLTLSNQLWGCF